jgi:hypothetical protein
MDMPVEMPLKLKTLRKGTYKKDDANYSKNKYLVDRADRHFNFRHVRTVPECLTTPYWYTQFADTDMASMKQKIDKFVDTYGVDYLLHYPVGVKAGTLLFLAAGRVPLAIIRYLVEEKNANINILGNSDFTPLRMAINAKKFNIVEYLIHQGAEAPQDVPVHQTITIEEGQGLDTDPNEGIYQRGARTNGQLLFTQRISTEDVVTDNHFSLSK